MATTMTALLDEQSKIWASKADSSLDTDISWCWRIAFLVDSRCEELKITLEQLAFKVCELEGIESDEEKLEVADRLLAQVICERCAELYFSSISQAIGVAEEYENVEPGQALFFEAAKIGAAERALLNERIESAYAADVPSDC